MFPARSMPLLLVLAGIAALPLHSQQPRTATPVPGVASPQPQTSRMVTAPATPAARPSSNAPHVIFHDGLLTVHAHNANLADVLNAIQRKTGASFEFPASAAQEPVAVDLGPAAPHDVLASLLNGSRFDYIVLGRQDDPNEIATVMLQEKSGANGAPIAQPAPAYPAAGNYQPPDEPEQPEDVPNEVPDDQQQPAPAPEDQNPKTPEQMLEELKQMQQQQQLQQQQQQQQNGQPQQPGQPQPGQPVAPGVQQVPPAPYPQGPGPQNYPPPPPPQAQPDDNEPHPK